MDRPQIHLRLRDPQMKADIERRAAERGISVNEWLNRAISHSLLKGGTVRVTEEAL